MIKSCFLTLHVCQASNHHPPHHFSPKLRLPNRQRAELLSVDQSRFNMSSFMWLLPGQRCILYHFALPISSILLHCQSQNQQLVS